MTVDLTRLRTMAAGYTAAWCSQDPTRVAAFFTPEGSLRVNDGAPAVGRDAIAAVAQGFMTAFPDMQVLMDDLDVEGGVLVYRWTLVGTNTGPGGTGGRVRIQGYEEWRVGPDDLIVSSLGHFDADQYARQLRQGP
jgi:hypothetical protein